MQLVGRALRDAHRARVPGRHLDVIDAFLRELVGEEVVPEQRAALVAIQVEARPLADQYRDRGQVRIGLFLQLVKVEAAGPHDVVADVEAVIDVEHAADEPALARRRQHLGRNLEAVVVARPGAHAQDRDVRHLGGQVQARVVDLAVGIAVPLGGVEVDGGEDGVMDALGHEHGAAEVADELHQPARVARNSTRLGDPQPNREGGADARQRDGVEALLCGAYGIIRIARDGRNKAVGQGVQGGRIGRVDRV